MAHENMKSGYEILYTQIQIQINTQLHVKAGSDLSKSPKHITEKNMISKPKSKYTHTPAVLHKVKQDQLKEFCGHG